MARTDELGVVLEARRDGLATVCVAFYELDDLCLFFTGAPLVKGGKIGEYEGIAIIGIARTIWEF